MGSASRYWRFVRLETGGNLKREDLASAKDFWLHQFPDLSQQADISDAAVQQDLCQLLGSEDEATRRLAECCLRCFISVHIELTCASLANQFGQQHGFTSQDLFPYVLTDLFPYVFTDRKLLTKRLQGSRYCALAIEILRTFDWSQGSSLGSWTARLVKHHPELKQFLLEKGVLLLSDWAILNDTRPAQVQRILSEFYPRSEAEIQQACDLLESYHAIYLRDRRTQRQGNRLCSVPSPSQLQEIAQHLRESQPKLLSETVLARLRALAMILRQHRLQVRGKVFRTQRSLDLQHEDGSPVIDPPAPGDEAETEQDEFLTQYRPVFEQCLDQAIAQITSDRLLQLKPPKDQKWLKALKLMHCQGMKMGAIAPEIELRAQDAVSRLLKLKDFRTDIRHYLLGLLGDRIQSLAQDYADPICLQNLDQRLNAVLEEQINNLMDTAQAETNIASRPLSSLFARRLCRHLDDRRIE
jgi:hypothetical protein